MSTAPADPPLDVSKPFTRAQALAAGITDQMLRSSAYQQLLHGVHVSSQVKATAAVRSRAALLAVSAEKAVISHVSAARLYGVPVPTFPEEHVSVLRAGERSRRRGVVCHVGPEQGTRRIDGMLVSSPERTFCELVSMLGLVDLVIAGDHMVRHDLTTPELLRSAVERSPLPRRRAARRAAALVRERVDSPAETMCRLLIVLADLPEPVVNQEVRTDEGLLLRRHDLAYPEQRLAIEVQGRHHIQMADTWHKDVEREEDSKSDGWRITNIIASLLFSDPESVLGRIHTAMQQSGVPGLPRRPSEGWRRYFGR